MTSDIIPNNGAVTLTEHGLQIHRPLTYDEWVQHVSTLKRVKSTYLSALADLTRHGVEQFGTERVALAMEQLEFDLQDAVKANAISSLTLGFRTEHSLTTEQAYVLAISLDDDAQRQQWAATCLREKLDAFELKKSIQAGHILRRDEIETGSGHGPAIPTIQGVTFQFKRWCKAVGSPEDLLKKPKGERMKILRALQPMIDLAAKIEASIA